VTTSGAPPTASTRGLFRVPLWFGFAAVWFLAIFLSRIEHLQPNWLVLAGLALVTLTFVANSLRDLVRMKTSTSSERKTMIGAIAGGLLSAMSLIYLSWHFGPAIGMRMFDVYVFPLLVPISSAFALTSLYVERKYHVRVYIGNSGWVFLPTSEPSNRTVETDARKSSARGSP